jgi:hypothetical protein
VSQAATSALNTAKEGSELRQRATSDRIERLRAQIVCSAERVKTCELTAGSGAPDCDSVPKAIDAQAYSARGPRFRRTWLDCIDHTHLMAMP